MGQPQTASRLRIKVSSTISGSITSLTVGYLVAESTFTYITTAYLAYTPFTSISLDSFSPFVVPLSLSNSVSTSSAVFAFLSGWDIIQSTNSEVSIFAKANLPSSNTVNI